MADRYDIMCQWKGCDVVFLSGNNIAKWCHKHRLPAKSLAMKRSALRVKNTPRVCETEGCEEIFTGDRRRRFCKKHAYGKRGKLQGGRGPNILPVVNPPKFAQKPVAVHTFGQMSTAQLLKAWGQWKKGKVVWVP